MAYRLCVYLMTGILGQGIWKEVEALQDPELKELAKSLPLTVLRSRAPSTVKKYSGAYLRWERWARGIPEVKCLPASPLHVALYLNFLVQKSATATPVQEAVSALSWAHQLAVVDDPTGHPLVQHTLAGAKRILAQPTVKKEPISAEILDRLVDRFGGESALLPDIRTITFCLLGFAGFLRFDELSKLKDSDIFLFEDHVELFIEASKTDQFRDGARVVVARTGSRNCPVAMLERYLQMAQISVLEPSGNCLFRGLVKTKGGYRLRASGGVSYTRVRELVLEMLEKIGLDRKKFGVHSLS